jgi:hypothetical protein
LSLEETDNLQKQIEEHNAKKETEKGAISDMNSGEEVSESEEAEIAGDILFKNDEL